MVMSMVLVDWVPSGTEPKLTEVGAGASLLTAATPVPARATVRLMWSAALMMNEVVLKPIPAGLKVTVATTEPPAAMDVPTAGRPVTVNELPGAGVLTDAMVSLVVPPLVIVTGIGRLVPTGSWLNVTERGVA